MSARPIDHPALHGSRADVEWLIQRMLDVQRVAVREGLLQWASSAVETEMLARAVLRQRVAHAN